MTELIKFWIDSMDSLSSIYIWKVFLLFIYVIPERRYCDVKSEKEIFHLRNVIIIIIVVVACGGKMYCLRFWCKTHWSY